MASVVLVPPCYSQNGTNPAANDVAGASVPCDSTQSDCVDSTGTPCTAAGTAVSTASALGYTPAGTSSTLGAGAAAPAAPTTPTPTTAPATNSSNSPGIMSGLVGLFSATSGVGSALNPPKTVSGVPMVYSAAAGGYVPASAAGTAVSNLSLSPTLIIVGVVAIAVIAYFALRRRG